MGEYERNANLVLAGVSLFGSFEHALKPHGYGGNCDTPGALLLGYFLSLIPLLNALRSVAASRCTFVLSSVLSSRS